MHIRERCPLWTEAALEHLCWQAYSVLDANSICLLSQVHVCHTHTYTYSQSGEETVSWGLVISQWSGDTSARVSTEHVACFPRVTSTKPTALLCFLSCLLEDNQFCSVPLPNPSGPSKHTYWSNSRGWILFFIRYLLSLGHKFWVLPFTECLIWSLQ